MATLSFKEYQLYYEVYGEGKPLLILNGIMMSTLSWKPFINAFSQNNQLVLMDLLDQGQSSKLKDLVYNQDIQVEAVKCLIETLELKDLALFGISYGGEVAIKLASAYPTLVERCLFFNTTAHTSEWLKEIGRAWNLASSNPESYYATTIPVIYSPQFFSRKIEWMNNRKKVLLQVFSNPEFIEAMVRLTNSANDLDERANLSKINCPCLVVGCEYDSITPFSNQIELAKGILNAQLVHVPDSGHALMYEKPILFTSLVLGFVFTNLLTDVI